MARKKIAKHDAKLIIFVSILGYMALVAICLIYKYMRM